MKKILFVEEQSMDTNDFYKDVTKGLAVLASNLKQSLEEANGIIESEPPVVLEKEDAENQIHIQDDSSTVEESREKGNEKNNV